MKSAEDVTRTNALVSKAEHDAAVKEAEEKDARARDAEHNLAQMRQLLCDVSNKQTEAVNEATVRAKKAIVPPLLMRALRRCLVAEVGRCLHNWHSGAHKSAATKAKASLIEESNAANIMHNALATEVKQLRSKLEACEVSKDEAEREISRLSANQDLEEGNAAQVELAEMRVKLAASEQSKHALEETVGMLQTQTEELDQQLQQERSIVCTLGGKLDAATEHEEKLAELTVVIDELKFDLESSRAEASSLKDSSSRDAHALAETQGKLEETERTLFQTEEKLADAVTKLDAASKEHADSLAAVKWMKAELEVTKEQQAAHLQSAIEERNAVIAASEDKVVGLETAIIELKSENAEKCAQLDSARAEANSLRDSASGDAATLAESLGKLAETESRLAEAERKLAQATAMNDDSVKEHCAALAASKAELQAAKEESVASLRAVVGKKDAAISASEQKLVELEAVLSELTCATAEKDSRLAEAQKQLTESVTRREKAEREHANALTAVNTKLCDAEAAALELKTNNEQLTALLQDERSEANSLRAALEKANQQLVASVNEQGELLAETESRLAEAERKLAQATAMNDDSVKEHCAALAASKAELQAAKEESVASLRAVVGKKDAAISASAQKLVELEAELRLVKTENDALKSLAAVDTTDEGSAVNPDDEATKQGRMLSQTSCPTDALGLSTVPNAASEWCEARDSHIAQLEKQLAESESRVRQLEIQGHPQSIAQEEHTGLQHQLHLKDKKAAELELALSKTSQEAKTQVGELECRLADTEEELTHTMAALLKRQATIGKLRDALAQTKADDTSMAHLLLSPSSTPHRLSQDESPHSGAIRSTGKPPAPDGEVAYSSPKAQTSIYEKSISPYTETAWRSLLKGKQPSHEVNRNKLTSITKDQRSPTAVESPTNSIENLHDSNSSPRSSNSGRLTLRQQAEAVFLKGKSRR